VFEGIGGTLLGFLAQYAATGALDRVVGERIDAFQANRQKQKALDQSVAVALAKVERDHTGHARILADRTFLQHHAVVELSRFFTAREMPRADGLVARWREYTPHLPAAAPAIAAAFLNAIRDALIEHPEFRELIWFKRDAADSERLRAVGDDVAALRRLLEDMQRRQAAEPRPVSQLPADLPDFEGREAEIALVEAALRAGGRAAIIAIDGMGGVGKSALAIHVAHRLAAQVAPDGVLHVELGGVSERPLTALDAMAEVIASFAPKAAKPTSERDAVAGFRAALNGKRVLLLLDNAKDAATVAPLFAHRPPGCAILVTSREKIVAPGATPVALEEMTLGEARKLLRAIVGEGRASDAELDEIARHCGCLPLALRVAGSFLARHINWPVEDYLKALADERGRLAKLKLRGMPKLDVAAVLGFSARQLAEEDRELAERWQTLAVFVESFDLAAAAAVWEVSADEALEGLGELVAQSMVRFDPDTSRYRLHDLMRDVAQLPLEGQDEDAIPARLEVVRARHARHYCDVLAAAGQLYLKGGEGVFGGLALYDLDQRNIAAGEAWAAARIAKDDVAARLSARYAEVAIDVLALRLHLRELVHWLEEQRRACERLGDRRGESAALGNSASYGGTLASQNEQFGIISRRSKSRARSATGWLRARDLVTWASLGITWVSHDVL
jgi:hypothetical protein